MIYSILIGESLALLSATALVAILSKEKRNISFSIDRNSIKIDIDKKEDDESKKDE